MIQAIGAIGYDYDPEYAQIVREMLKLGLTPSGNKAIDKSRLKSTVEHKVEELVSVRYEESPREMDERRAELEEIREGAMQLGILNRVLLGI